MLILDFTPNNYRSHWQFQFLELAYRCSFGVTVGRSILLQSQKYQSDFNDFKQSI